MIGNSAGPTTCPTARRAATASRPSWASPGLNSTLALISTVMPKAPSVTRTWPSATSGASTLRISSAMFLTRSALALRASSISGLGGGPLGRIDGMGADAIWALLVCTPSLRKALTTESDMIRYLPSFTDESEYITTKKANSRVMKSA